MSSGTHVGLKGPVPVDTSVHDTLSDAVEGTVGLLVHTHIQGDHDAARDSPDGPSRPTRVYVPGVLATDLLAMYWGRPQW